MKAWSRAQHAQEREAGLYAHHQAEAELISSYLNSHQAVEAAVAAVSSQAASQQQPYGVPIPPPLVPHGGEDQHPLPPTRSTSSSGGNRSRGKRSRHAGTSSRSSNVAPGDIHYPKYDLYGYKYNTNTAPDQCQYTTKYGEDCHFSSGMSTSKCAYNKTWPKQHCGDEEGRVYTQDDQQVQYLDQLDHQQQHSQQPQQSRPKKKKHHNRDRSPQQLDSYPCFSSRDREYLVSTGQTTRHYIHESAQNKAAHDPIPAIEEVGRYIEQAESRAKSVKDIARDLAKDRAALAQVQAEQQQINPDQQNTEKPEEINPENIPPPQEQQQQAMEQPQAQPQHNLQTFNPQASTKAEVQLQQEHIQYVDNECCQVAVGVVNETAQQASQQQQSSATLPSRSRQPQGQQTAGVKKTGTMSAAQMSAASQFATLERNMAEVAERNRQSRAELQANQTLDRSRSRYGDSCDTCDAPLTPASLAGIDHRDLEHRPLTRSVTRATVYDEPPEK